MTRHGDSRTNLLGKKRSAMSYVVEALIPFTDANMKLSFAPSAFFRELAETTDTDSERLRRAYYRAKRSGVVRYVDGHFAIDPAYIEKAQRNSVQRLQDGQSMLVIYDIPEDLAPKRRELRSLLRELEFAQVQKSVWQTPYNHLEPVLATIAMLHIKPYVQVFVGTTQFDSYMML
mgnify:CR=1 FL=1